MGKGLGPTQQQILAEVEQRYQDAPEHSSRPDSWSLTIAELAEMLDRSPRQIRTAVHALAKRKLVWVVKTDVDYKVINEDTDDAFEMPVMGLRVFTHRARLSQLENANEERLAVGEAWKLHEIVRHAESRWR